MERQESEVCIACKTNEHPLRMLTKYVWNLTLATSYLLARDSSCDFKCSVFNSGCPELASYLFLWAVTLWLCGRNLAPPCLSVPTSLSPIYHLIAIPVLSSVIHRLLWTDLIGFLAIIEYILHQMISGDSAEEVSYQSVFDPTLVISLSDVIAVLALVWVLKAYSIIECIVFLINKFKGGAHLRPLLCVKQQDPQACPFAKKEPSEEEYVQ